MSSVTTAPDHEVIIIGAGFSGIGASKRLSDAGIDDHILLEQGEDVGGTWYWNRYPGLSVDIPSFSYQFSFERRTDWSRIYASGAELHAYARDCAEKYGVRERVRFRTKVTEASFDEQASRWRLAIDGGEELTARFVIGATGVFTNPVMPEIEGIDDFAGEVVHTSRWPEELDLRGKRVAIIGTGASAVQVIPAIAPKVEQLTVFQRTPIWCLPKPDRPMPGAVSFLMKRVPFGDLGARIASQAFVEATFPLPLHFGRVLPLSKWAERIGRRHLEEQVEDPELREKLTPRYAVGCKRPGFHNTYLRTFNRENVTLETTPIERITASGVQVAGGDLHDAEVLICATGFKVMESGNMPPFTVRGTGGLDLERFWDENRLQAYEGVSIPRFPNLFMILGPYGYNGSSYFNLIENQTRHILRCLRRARGEGATRVEVRPEANERYFRSMLARRKNQLVWQDSCALANSYYFDKHGDVPFRASPTLETIWRSARFDLDDYRFERPVAPEAAPASEAAQAA